MLRRCPPPQRRSRLGRRSHRHHRPHARRVDGSLFDRTQGWGRWWALTLLLFTGCTDSAGHFTGNFDPPVEPVPPFTASLQSVDESGTPLPTTATFVTDAGDATIEGRGTGSFTCVGLTQPALVRFSAPGYIDEFCVVDRSGASQSVRLLARASVGGTRRVFHFGGDVMLGRRYLEPTSEETARVVTGDGGASARAVVSAIAPLFRAADLRSINLETVVGNLPLADAYPRKRFLLQSPPEVTALIDELDATVVTLGNNHIRDWLGAGVTETLNALDAAGLDYVGAGHDPTDAAAPLLLDVDGLLVGMISVTSVNGDFVNDNLPRSSDPVPSPIPLGEEWQYELRTFGFVGATVNIPSQPMTVGDAWDEFENAEGSGASQSEIDTLWGSMFAVFPELQDWVARRGHDGANPYDLTAMTSAISDLRSSGAALIVVQFHSGFQFSEVKSSFVEGAAHDAIDAGADMVIAHHPHVLQGFEFYKDRFIAYSLGNFVFDQDFLATFPSMVLRTVFEGTNLLEVRAYPVVIDDYRPAAIGGEAARQLLQTVSERSTLPYHTRRLDGVVRMVPAPANADVEVPHLIAEWGTARVEPGSAPTELHSLTLDVAEIADLPGIGLTRTRGTTGMGLGDVFLGRDLYQWGTFEDWGADGVAAGGTHWFGLNTSFKRIEVLTDDNTNSRALRLRRSASNSSDVIIRPVARIPLTQHRFFEEMGGSAVAVDQPPFYTLRFNARWNGLGSPFARFDVYDFDDSNPTADPESQLLRQRIHTLPLEGDDQWHGVAFNIPTGTFLDAGALEANSLLLYLGLTPPIAGTAVLLIDDLQFIEWRDPSDLPDLFVDVDAVRFQGTASGSVTLERTTQP